MTPLVPGIQASDKVREMALKRYLNASFEDVPSSGDHFLLSEDTTSQCISQQDFRISNEALFDKVDRIRTEQATAHPVRLAQAPTFLFKGWLFQLNGEEDFEMTLKDKVTISICPGLFREDVETLLSACYSNQKMLMDTGRSHIRVGYRTPDAPLLARCFGEDNLVDFFGSRYGSIGIVSLCKAMENRVSLASLIRCALLFMNLRVEWLHHRM